MRRTYREKIYRCGDYIDVQVFPVFNKGNTRRKRRSKPTSEMQAKLNQKNAERALIRLLNANFTEDDISATLTFRDEFLPESYEEAERMAKNFLRRVKRLRAKKGLDEIKYIMIPGPGRFHFHIPMSGGLTDKELQALWPYGYLNCIHFEFNESGLEGHARYVAKQYEEDQYGGEDLFSMYEVDEETGEVSSKNQLITDFDVANAQKQGAEYDKCTEEENATMFQEGKKKAKQAGKANRAKGKRRYNCSRNIVRPEAEEKDGRISAAKVEELATVDSASRAAFEKLYPGYCLADCKPYYNEENGGYYLEIRLYRSDAAFIKTRQKYRRRR